MQHSRLPASGFILPPFVTRGSLSWQIALQQSVRSALAALTLYRLRSAIMLLGIAAGVCGVLLTTAFGQFAGGVTRAENTQLGATVVTVLPTAPIINGKVADARGPTLTVDDITTVRRLPHVIAVTPVVKIGGRTPVTAGAQTWNSDFVAGVYPAYQTTDNDSLQRGAFFTDQDETTGATVAVIGQTVLQKLFPAENPLGQQVRLGTTLFTVVGVLTTHGDNGGRDLDDTVLIPFSTAQQRLGAGATFPLLSIRVDATVAVAATASAVEQALRQTHHLAAGQPSDFLINTNEQAIIKQQQDLATVGAALGIAGGVALLLGGFGVGSLMLLRVRERMREIGLRMAVGAQPGHVLTQFLMEAALLSILGAGFGILASLAVTWALAGRINVLPVLSTMPHVTLPVPSLLAISVTLAFALLLGTLSGYYPARRAARLNPLEALRDA